MAWRSEPCRSGGITMSLRTIAVSGLAVAGLLLGPAAEAQAAAPVQLTGTQLASR